jgi:molybdopterin-guanine dinucleotide biosynthesis protein B
MDKPVQYAEDPYVVAIATDSAERLPVATQLPRLDLNDPDAIAAFLLDTAARYEYRSPLLEP